MRHSIRTIVLGASVAAALVAAGGPREARAASSSATFDFGSSAGGIQDSAGRGTGLEERLPGTGGSLAQSDTNLTLLTSSGRLRVSATPSDINDTTGDGVGENLSAAEFLGVRLSDVEPRFGPASDFSVSAVLRSVPDLGAGAPQYGVFAGTSANAVVRGGVLHGDNWRFTATSQNGRDSRPLTTTGSVVPGHDLRIELSRVGGTWAMSITDLTTSIATNLVFPPQPTFLDAATDLWVGVFAGCPSGSPFPIEVDSLTVQAEPDDAVVVGPPATPVNLSASYAAGEGVILSWDGASDDETGFELQRRAGSLDFAVRATTGPDVASFTDGLLAPLTTFTYRVRALKGTVVSDWSAEASVTTPSDAPRAAPPAAPGQLTLTQLGASNSLTWTDESSDEVRFEVQRAEGGTPSAASPLRLRARRRSKTPPSIRDGGAPTGCGRWRSRGRRPGRAPSRPLCPRRSTSASSAGASSTRAGPDGIVSGSSSGMGSRRRRPRAPNSTRSRTAWRCRSDPPTPRSSSRSRRPTPRGWSTPVADGTPPPGGAQRASRRR